MKHNLPAARLMRPEDSPPNSKLQGNTLNKKTTFSTLKSALMSAALSTALALAGMAPAAQARAAASEASALSMLPIAVSVAAPAALGASVLVGGSLLTVVAVETVSGATVWVLERASDGARFSVTLAGSAVAGVSVAAGTAVLVTAFSAGWVLSASGKAIAYIPNEIGKALLHNERIMR